MARLLIIEDEQVIRSALKRMLERNSFRVSEAGSIADAEARFALPDFDLIISDLRLPGAPGTEVMQRCGEVPVLIMTSYASVKSAVDAMHRGAADYIAKPFDHDEFLQAVRRILDHHQQPVAQSPMTPTLAGMVGACAAMQEVFQRIHKVAATDTTVLILGESGTGKELVARALHEHSPRHKQPLIAVNCAAIPESLIEPELFGHERGAFTGAVGAREGLVEAAHNGTLFLDEIGELTLNAQARLLRVLQEGEIRRVGSARPCKVDIRLIAATHRDLEQWVRDGQLRSDLYYRLRVMEIRLPPLRERGEDVIQLSQFILEKACRRLKRPLLQFSSDTLAAIRAHPWPGNVRELENAIERAVILCEGETLTPDLLALEQAEFSAATGVAAKAMSLTDYFEHFVLSNQGHLTETELARRLGISRKSLWERRQRLGIPRTKNKR